MGAALHSAFAHSRRCEHHRMQHSHHQSGLLQVSDIRVVETHLSKQQRIQNKLVRVVCDVGNRDCHTIVLHLTTHWLLVRSRIEFEVETLCFKSLYVEQPCYLRDILHSYVPSRTLLSTNKQRLALPRTKTKTAARRFSCACPDFLNWLPSSLCSVDSAGAFKSQLKALFFRRDFN